MAEKNRFGPDAFQSTEEPNPFGPAAYAAGAKANRFGPGSSDLAALQQEVDTSGASTFLDTALQAGGALVDLIMRPTYAVTGGAQELLKGGGITAAVPRAASELFSGIGPIQGQKKGFGQVMEEAGVPTGPQLSDAVPLLYSETGEGLPLKRGGAFDPSLRGVVGTALDIGADPLLGPFGVLGKAGKAVMVGGKALTGAGEEALAKGTAELMAKPTKDVVRDVLVATNQARDEATLLGKPLDEVAFQRSILPQVARRQAEDQLLASTEEGLFKEPGAVSQAASQAVQAVKNKFEDTRVGKAFDSVMNLVKPGWNIRDLEGAHELGTAKDALTRSQSARIRGMIQAARESFALDKDELKSVIVAIDEGKTADLAPKLKAASDWIEAKGQQVLELDQKAGIFDVEPRPNYIAHFYENTPEEYNTAVARYSNKPVGQEGSLGRHLEQRAFDTLKEGEAAGLTPVYDPFEALQRRMIASTRARNFRDYEGALASRFGKDAVRFNVEDAYDLTARTLPKLKPAEAKTVQDALALKGEPKLAAVRAMSDDAKRAFFEERVSQMKSPQEAIATLGKYEEFKGFFPKALKPLNDLAPNGEPWADITLKGQGVRTLPRNLRDYVMAQDRNLFDYATPEGKGFRKFLDAWDWVNNTFKLGVTIFPAFHVRNFYNNVMQSFAEMGAAIFDPEVRMGALRMLGNKDGEFVTKFGKWKLSDLKNIFEDKGVIVPGNDMFEYAGQQSGKTAFRKGIEKYQGKIGGAIENEGRVAHALGMLKQGHSLEDAVASVNKTLVNYQDLTKAEREVFRRIFPFWTWNARNAAFQLDTILHRPQLLATQVKPFAGRASENNQLTSWDAGAMKLRLNGDGKTVQMITGVDLPVRNLDLLWRGSLAKTGLGIAGMMSPIIKTGLETAFKTSAFTGKPFDRAQSGAIGRLVAHAPQPVQHWLGFKQGFDKAGRPSYTMDGQRFYLLFQSWAASRFISTSDRQFREWAKDPSLANILLDVGTGLRYKDVNFASEKQQKDYEDRMRYLEALKRAGARREFSKIY